MSEHDNSSQKQNDLSPTQGVQEISTSGMGSFSAMQQAIKQPSRQTLTPTAVLQLQQTIGNVAVQRLLAGADSPSTIRPTEFKFAKTNAPIIQRVLDGNAGNDDQQDLAYGVVYGHYKSASNVADAHIGVGGEDQGLAKADMLSAVRDIYQAMQNSSGAGNPVGTVELNPQGAVALKTVVELLGHALGGWWGKAKALAFQFKRKKFGELTKDKLADELDQAIIPEHMAFLRAMIGVGGVSMKPVIGGELTMEEFDQNMLDDTDEGKARMAAYQQKLQDDEAVSMRVEVSETVLPQIIELLSN